MIVRGQLNEKIFRGELDHQFWNGYDTLPAMYQQFYHVQGSSKADEQHMGMVGFGAMRSKSEYGSISEVDFTTGLETRYTHLRYALGMRVSYEVLKDHRFGVVAKAVRLFGRSAIVTKETLAALRFNRAFNGSYVWNPGVSVPLISTSHLLDDGITTVSNRLSPDADFDTESLQAMATLVRSAVDQAGVKTGYRLDKIVGAPANQFIFKEILTSTDRPDTAERATNVMKNYVTDLTWDYLTDDDAWFGMSNDHGLYWYDRDPLSTDEEPIAQTGGDRFYMAHMRCSCGPDDWRGIWGTSGGS